MFGLRTSAPRWFGTRAQRLDDPLSTGTPSRLDAGHSQSRSSACLILAGLIGLAGVVAALSASIGPVQAASTKPTSAGQAGAQVVLPIVYSQVASGPSSTIYGGMLASGWSNWSWNTSVNLSVASLTYNGDTTLGFTYTAPWAGLSFHTNKFNASGYTTLQFVVDGGSASGQLAQVALYGATAQQLSPPVPLNSYIAGGSIAAGQWRQVTIPLSALNGVNQTITGVVIQDMSGHSQPTIYLDNLGFSTASVSLSPTPQPASPTASPLPATATPIPRGSATVTPTPTQTGVVNWGSQEPFTSVGDESYQSKGAEQWLPEVKAAVNDAVNQGLLNAGERQLWENILLGQIDVESTGHAFLVNGSSPNYSQGLTQNAAPWLEYAEEDPFDPLTNLRSLLRTEIRYYRKWGNRWDRAVGEYLTGSEDPTCQETCGDGNTTGLSYFERVVNAVWWVQSNAATAQNYPPQDNSYQAACSGGTCWFSNAPTWNLWSSPNLAYNWVPPSNQNGYNYYTEGVDSNISQPIDQNTWLPVPSWFYTTSPESTVPLYVERAPTAQESQEYPPGKTVLTGPNQETYPRRTWSLSNP